MLGKNFLQLGMDIRNRQVFESLNGKEGFCLSHIGTSNGAHKEFFGHLQTIHTLDVGVQVVSQKMEGIIKVLALEEGTADIHPDEQNQPGLGFGEKIFRNTTA